MGNIGGEIVTGALSALWDIITKVPLFVWLILFVAICIAIAVMRVVTNWKVDVVLIALAALVALIFGYREHWIAMGKAEDEAQIAAYKATNAAVIACYTKNATQTYLWDRSQGKCLRQDGAIE